MLFSDVVMFYQHMHSSLKYGSLLALLSDGNSVWSFFARTKAAPGERLRGGNINQ
jgi:hypothetical protein